MIILVIVSIVSTLVGKLWSWDRLLFILVVAIESLVYKLVGKFRSWVRLMFILTVAIESLVSKLVGKLRSWVRLICILVPRLWLFKRLQYVHSFSCEFCFDGAYLSMTTRNKKAGPAMPRIFGSQIPTHTLFICVRILQIETPTLFQLRALF